MSNVVKSRKSLHKSVTFENDEDQESSSRMSFFPKTLNIFIMMVLLAITGYIIFRTVSDVGLILYTLHPVLISFGYLTLMAHGILVMADKHALTQHFNYKERITTHWVLQAVALVLITVAQSAIYINKERNGYPHYQTTHSLFGLTTYLLTLGASFGGVLTKYSSKLRSFVKPSMLKIGHGYAGSVVFTLASSTIFLGLNQSWTNFGDMQVKFTILGALIISTIYVVSKSFKTATLRALKKE